ncbi:hypothetical protein ABFS82_14G278500 [Erythranthe guttata]
MAAVQNRFLQPQQPPGVWRNRWGGCLGGLSCFQKQKGGKRIVPASRIPETNTLPNHPRLSNQTSGISSSLLAPPSSPATFSNCTTPSTAQSPRCFLSASSPENPSSTMFVTGPYAYETQLVSPPVFSTFTTEPSTAPFTPPPELAHLTTPSSPDVPYARFLTSSAKFKSSDKTNYIAANDIQNTYTGSGRFVGAHEAGVSKSQQESNFFCPETFAQFYVDQSSVSNSGGRLSISREPDAAYVNGGYGYQNRQNNKTSKTDADELEAYRASFGFSADEIITTNNYVEISDVLEESFSITPFTSEIKKRQEAPNHFNSVHARISASYNGLEDQVRHKRLGESFHSNSVLSDDDVFTNTRGLLK